MIKEKRHGDLFLRPVQKIEGKVIDNKGSFILAEGETTGHKHVITSPKMEIRQADNGRYYIHLEEEGKLTHEEHKTITIQPGDYEVINEREKDWFSLAVKKVVD